MDQTHLEEVAISVDHHNTIQVQAKLDLCFWHVISQLVIVEVSNSSYLCPLLAVSILYFEKKIRNRLREYSKIGQFDTYQIAFLMRNQGH